MAPNNERGEDWLVVVGVSVMNLAIFPVVQCFGLIYEDVFQDLGMSTVDISLLIQINNGVASIFGLLCAPLLRQFSFQFTSILGSAFCCISICLMSRARAWIIYMLTYSVLFGVGQGILFPSTTVALNSHFSERRSLAVGLSVAATSFGPVLSPYIVNTLLSIYGTSGTVLLLGGVALHSLPGGMLLRKTSSTIIKRNDVMKTNKLLKINERRDCNLDIHETKDLVVKSIYPASPKNQKMIDHQSVEEPEGKECDSIVKKYCARVVQAFDLDLLKDPVYVNIAAGMGISIASEFNFQMLLPFILVDMAYLDKHILATVISIQAIADIVARIGSPFLADWFHWNSRCAYLISLLGTMLGRTVLAHFHHDYQVIVIHAIIYGSFKGCRAVFQSLILPSYVPIEKLAAASGLYMIINGILSIFCGPIIGVIRDNSDSYISALYTTSALSFLCVFSWTAEYLFRCYKKTKRTALKETIKLYHV